MADVIREREVRETPVREPEGSSSGAMWVIVVLLILALFWWMLSTGRFGTSTPQQDSEQSPSINIQVPTPDTSGGTTSENGAAPQQ